MSEVVENEGEERRERKKHERKSACEAECGIGKREKSAE